MDGTLDSTTKATVGANGLYVEARAGSSIIGSIKLTDGVDTALVSGAGELSVDPSDRAGRLLGIIASIASAVDISDRVGRLVGHVAIDNFPATQPVSLAAAVDVSDRVGRSLGIIASITAAVDVADRVGRLLGVIASITNPVAVTGTFWQATQPVSGTFWQATQPVSIAAAVDVSDRSARLLGVISAGANLIGKVEMTDGVDTALVTTSGFLQVEQARDIGRTAISIKFNSAAAPIADTLCSCIKNAAGVDGAGATTFAVTAGKIFRVTGLKLSVRTTTAATPWGEATIRMNPSGAAVIGSPYVHRLTVGGNAAVIGNVAADYYFFPEGWELSGTMQLGISFANNVATNVTDLVLFGYEYTP